MEFPNLRDLGRQLKDARREIRQLEATLACERAESSERAAQSSAHLDEMRRSTSWRLTAPLRWLRTTLPRKRHGQSGETAAGPPPDVVTSGLAGLPAGLLKPDFEDLETANATCRRINLFPGLDGLVAEDVRLALAGTMAETGGEYRGRRQDPPAIGFIGSTELRTELSFDARVAVLDEDNWRDVLVPGALRFLLVETVWHVEHRHWRYALTGEGNQEDFWRVLERCREISLPLVVWFRETPDNYPRFAWLAGQADLVCAADAEVLERLRSDFPRTKAEFLPPAIQPPLHNPLRSYGLMDAADALGGSIVFDGWWDLQNGLPELSRLHDLKGSGLLVAESHWDFSRVRLDDADDFRDWTVGCLDREEKLVMSRLQGAEVFAAASLAGAWRSALGMARSAASGSLVARLDGAPPWLPELRLPDGGVDPLVALRALMADPVASARRRHQTWRGLMSAHTVAHRLQHIADSLGTGGRFLPSDPRIACLMVTMRPDRLRGCIERFRNDAYPDKELVVVVHGNDAGLEECRKLVREGEPIRFLQAGKSLGLGACLNLAASQTDAPYWTKVDDDDLYGTHYLSDIMLYQRIGKFDVFGKPPVFNYLESSDELLWDVEWARHANLVHDAATARSALVAGGTLGGHRRVLEEVPFSERRRGGSDSDFVRRCYEAGLDVLAMDGFNFVRCRSAQEGFHTWTIDEDEFRSRSLRVGSLEGESGLALC